MKLLTIKKALTLNVRVIFHFRKVAISCMLVKEGLQKHLYTDIKVTGFQSRACVVSALVYVSSSLSML